MSHLYQTNSPIWLLNKTEKVKALAALLFRAKNDNPAAMHIDNATWEGLHDLLITLECERDQTDEEKVAEELQILRPIFDAAVKRLQPNHSICFSCVGGHFSVYRNEDEPTPTSNAVAL